MTPSFNVDGVMEIASFVIYSSKSFMLRFYLSFQQAKHFLQHVFGWPYDVNYYAGDWLMGPNYFCWQPICYMAYGINAFAWHVKPHTYSDVQHVIDKIMKHKETIGRYRFVAFQVVHNIFLLSFFFFATIVFFGLCHHTPNISITI